MSLDLEGVLRAHYLHGYACGDDCTYVVNSAGGWAAHVAAVLREQIAAWLTGEAEAADESEDPGRQQSAGILCTLAAHLSDTERSGDAG